MDINDYGLQALPTRRAVNCFLRLFTRLPGKSLHPRSWLRSATPLSRRMGRAVLFSFPVFSARKTRSFHHIPSQGTVFMFSFPHLPSHRLPVPELFSPPMHPRPQHRAGAAFSPPQPPLSPKFFFPESFSRSTGRLSTLHGMHRLSPFRFGVSKAFHSNPAVCGLIARGAALPNSPSPP